MTFQSFVYLAYAHPYQGLKKLQFHEIPLYVNSSDDSMKGEVGLLVL